MRASKANNTLIEELEALLDVPGNESFTTEDINDIAKLARELVRVNDQITWIISNDELKN